MVKRRLVEWKYYLQGLQLELFWADTVWTTVFSVTSIMLAAVLVVVTFAFPISNAEKSKRKRGGRRDLTLLLVAGAIAIGFVCGQFVYTNRSAFMCSSLMVASPGLLLAMWRHGRCYDGSGD